MIMSRVLLGVTVLVLLTSTNINALSSHNDEKIENDCSLNKLNECLDEMYGDREALGKLVVPYFSDDQLDDMCRSWEDAQACKQHVQSSCEAAPNTTNPLVLTEVQQRIREVDVGHEYLCESDRRQDYRTNIQTCAEEKQDELTSVAKTCQETYHNTSWYYDKTNPDNIYAFCNVAKTYLSCLEEHVMTTCGQAVAKWARVYHVALWMPHLNTISCDPSTGMETGALFIITFCAGAAIFTVAISIASFVKDSESCTKLRKRCNKGGDGKGEYAMQAMESVKDL